MSRPAGKRLIYSETDAEVNRTVAEEQQSCPYAPAIKLIPAGGPTIRK
jgi:hypothetical protein